MLRTSIFKVYYYKIMGKARLEGSSLPWIKQECSYRVVCMYVGLRRCISPLAGEWMCLVKLVC